MKFLEKTKAIPGALKRRFLMASTAMMALVATAVPAFAAGDSLDYFTVTNADLKPLMDSIVANIKVLFPIILTITGIFIIINLVPRILRRAVSG